MIGAVRSVASSHVKEQGVASHPRRAVELDVVRGVAILLAMGWHFNTLDVSPFLLPFMYPAHLWGWVGVDIFFVLSGFLVGGLIIAEVQETGAFDARRFLIRRAFKIWPILYVYLAAQVALNIRPWSTYLVQCLLHVQNYAVTPLLHLWSLAVEEHFYMLFALVAVVLEAKAFKHRLPHVLFGIIAVAVVARCIAVFLHIDPVSIKFQSHYRMDALAFGVLLAWVRINRPGLFEKLASMSKLHVGILGCCAVFLRVVPESSAQLLTFGFIFTYVAGAALLLLAVRFNNQLRPSKAAAVLAWLGTYSYALYVWHVGMNRIVGTMAAKYQWIVELTSLQVVLKYLGSIAAAVIVTRLVEQPSLRLRDRLFPARGRNPYLPSGGQGAA